MLRRQLDPNFADACGYLAIDRNLGETQQEQENLKRAFALKDRASARSRSQIEGGYHSDVTGEVHKGIDALRSRENLEPNLFPPHNLGLRMPSSVYTRSQPTSFDGVWRWRPISQLLMKTWPPRFKRKASARKARRCWAALKTKVWTNRSCATTNWRCCVPMPQRSNESGPGWRRT